MRLPVRLAADIGGTFTDVVRLDVATGAWTTTKAPTTPTNLAEGIVAGFDQVMEGDYADVLDIVHGTTFGLNALIRRAGASTAVITTKGFRDVYEIGRGNHPEMYNVHYRKPAPLVARRDVFELNERIRADGSVEREVALEDIIRIARELDGRYESIAICLLNSFANAAHEELAGRLFADHLSEPIAVTLSSAISRETREFERFSTAILNAYIAPPMRGYLASLEQTLRQRGFLGQLWFLGSNGGLLPPSQAKAEPVRTLMSGPVGGVIGARAVSAALELHKLVAVDMGGTSFDVSVLSSAKLDISLETAIADVPVVVPTINTLSVGAGGGSIAWTEAGAMRVGPGSSGSVPGPICYGRGGTQPTVTDANLVLGRVDPDGFLGGRLRLQREQTQAAFDAYGDTHSLTGIEAAEGTLEITNSKMADAIREVTLRRGKDIRDFTLLAYGGAGPMHAALIADQLGVDRVVIPPAAGAFSAWGMLYADLERELAVPVLRELDGFAAAEFDAICAASEGALSARIAAADGSVSAAVFTHSLDMRYVGQQYSINVELDGRFDPSDVRAAFDAKYNDLYGFATASARVAILNVRTTATVATAHKPVLSAMEGRSEPTGVARKVVVAYFDGEPHLAPVHLRGQLAVRSVEGPALVVEPTSTVVVPLGWHTEQDTTGCLILSRSGGGGSETR